MYSKPEPERQVSSLVTGIVAGGGKDYSTNQVLPWETWDPIPIFEGRVDNRSTATERVSGSRSLKIQTVTK